MTLTQEARIECPGCKNKQTIQIWQSVDVTMDPNLKDDLLEGKVNWFDCASCEFSAFVPVSLLYNDVGMKFCVQLVPFDDAVEPDFLQKCNPDGTFRVRDELGELTKENANVGYMARQHIVFSMEELVHYVLFRDKLAEFHQGDE